MRRRELVLAAAGAVLARPAAAAGAGVEGDPAIVERLTAREQSAAFAHRGSPALPGLALHEADHANALRSELSALGQAGPPPPRGASELDGPARRVVEARGSAVLDAQIELEASLLAAYREALTTLVEPSILRTAATIAASHAQHHALLRREAGLDPLR